MSIRRLHLWVPEWSGPGGIQAYSRHLAHACAEQLSPNPITVLVRNGPLPRGDLPPGVVGHSAGGVPAPGRRLIYALLLAITALRERPDLVLITHLHFAPLAWLLHRLLGFRYWVVAHGVEAWGTPSAWRRRALSAADKILPVSCHTARRVRAQLGDAGPKIECLPNTVDESIFRPGPKPLHLRRRYGLGPRDTVLLTVARLDPNQRYKGCDCVLEALARLDRPNLRYLIAGRGADSTRLRRRVLALGLAGRVVLTGYVPEDELPEHYRLCDIFVMPSQAEGFGIVFLEALASGCRVVAGNRDASSEPLLGGKLGALIDPRDSAALAETIARLADDAPDPAAVEFRRRAVIDHFGVGAFRRRLREVLV